MIYLKLFISYLKIGFFGFGGGYAMLSLIQNEIVVQNQWMTNAEFADIVAISQMTPGPIAINCHIRGLYRSRFLGLGGSNRVGLPARLDADDSNHTILPQVTQ